MSHSNISKRKATLFEPELKCKNDCGFYGNPEWLGYCSKCHKELNQKVKPERSAKTPSKTVQRSYSDAHESAFLGFSKFEEKKKNRTEKKSIKNIMKRGHTMKESITSSPSRDLFPVNEIYLLNKNLKVKDAVSKDIIKQINHILQVMSKYYDKPTDEQSDVVQDFYNFMVNRFETHPAYQDLTSEQVDQLLDNVEEVLMSHLHRHVSQQISSEYEEKDLAIQKRIRSLNWISSRHLGISITETSPEVRDLIDKAIADMIEMDSRVVPQHKIKCIVRCSESIFNIIKVCQGVTASADEFLPAMVYVVLRANPPLLQSNIKYITSYSMPARLRSGEGAYYFTNLCCAVAFIEDMTAESLNMNEEEFNSYVSGEAAPFPDRGDASSCEGLRLMNLNLLTLNEIEEKNRRMMNELSDLKEDMNKFQETIQKCKPQTSLINPNPYTIPSNTDMSLVPEVLRGRVLFEPNEDILVDIDERPLPPETDVTIMSTSPDQATPSSSYVSEMIDISQQKEATPSSSYVSEMIDVSQQKEATPSSSYVSEMIDVSLQKEATPSRVECRRTFSQAIADIQDLEYPTDMIPELKNEDSVEFGPYEGCDSLEAVSQPVPNPLLPVSAFGLDEPLNLPPPLQPVVIQSLNEPKTQ